MANDDRTTRLYTLYLGGFVSHAADGPVVVHAQAMCAPLLNGPEELCAYAIGVNDARRAQPLLSPSVVVSRLTLP